MSGPASDSRSPARWLPLVLWGAWAVILFRAYYRQFWRLLLGDHAAQAALVNDAYASLGFTALMVAGLVVVVGSLLLVSAIRRWQSRSIFRTGRWKIELTASAVLSMRKQADDQPWKAIAVLAGLIALMGALAPETEHDALWYHLWLPKLWLEHGYPVDLVAEYISLYPLTWELVYGMGLALGGPIAAKLAHLACLPLTALLVHRLVRRFVPWVSPWQAVAFFATVPTVLWEATTAYNDLALTMYVALAIYALLRYIERPDRQWFVLASVNLGLASATKHLGLLMVVILTGLLATALWLRGRCLMRAVMPAASLGLLSLLLPLPWHARNWLASHNPVFPDLYGIFGAVPSERWSVFTEQALGAFKASFGQPRTLLHLLTLPWDMTVHASGYGGSLGPLFLLLIPALLVVQRSTWAIPWISSLVFLYLMVWYSPVSSMQMRYTIPLTPMLAVLATEAFGRLALLLRDSVGRWGRIALRGGVAILLVLNLPPFTSFHESDRLEWHGWLTHVIRQVPMAVVLGRESQEHYLLRSVPSYAVWRYINTHLPRDVRVLTFSGGDHFYSERQRLWSDSTMAYPAVWGAPRGKEQQALDALRRLGISHILFDRRQLDSLAPSSLAVTQPSVVAYWYELDYEDARFLLYRLRWERDWRDTGNSSWLLSVAEGGASCP